MTQEQVRQKRGGSEQEEKIIDRCRDARGAAGFGKKLKKRRIKKKRTQKERCTCRCEKREKLGGVQAFEIGKEAIRSRASHI